MDLQQIPTDESIIPDSPIPDSPIPDSQQRPVSIGLQDFYPETKCCSKNKIQKDIDWKILYTIIKGLKLTNVQKELILIRFKRIFTHIDKHFQNINFYYNKSKIFIITAGILNPALLSITSNQTANMYTILFWSVWSLQLMVSLVTAYVNFFKWDKKYFLYMAYKQRVEQEIWTYLELTGKYNIVNPLNLEECQTLKTTHSSKLKRFLFQLETIYKKLLDNDIDIENTDNDIDVERFAFSNEKESKQQNLEINKHITQLKKEIQIAESNNDSDKVNSLQQELRRYNVMKKQNVLQESQLYSTSEKPVAKRKPALFMQSSMQSSFTNSDESKTNSEENNSESPPVSSTDNSLSGNSPDITNLNNDDK